MANNESIQILRGSRAKVVDNLSNLIPGQPLFDKTDNYLLIGQDNGSKNKQPITTNRIKGYYGDISGISGSRDSYPYSLDATSDGTSNYKLTLNSNSGELEIKSGKGININTFDSDNNSTNYGTVFNSIILHGDASTGIDINGNTTIKGDIIKFQNSNNAKFFVANKSESKITISYDLEVSGNIDGNVTGDLIGTATKVQSTLSFISDTKTVNENTSTIKTYYDGETAVDLSDHVVNTHSNQDNINGDKTFTQDVTVGGIFKITDVFNSTSTYQPNPNEQGIDVISISKPIYTNDNDIYLGSGTIHGSIEVTGISTSTVTVNELLAQTNGNTKSIGNEDTPFSTAYVLSTISSVISGAKQTNNNVTTYTLKLRNQNTDSPSSQLILGGDGILIRGNMLSAKDTNNNPTYSLGNSSYPFNQAYIKDTIYSPKIMGGSNTDTTTTLTLQNNQTPNSSIILTNSGVQLNGSSIKLGSTTVGGNYQPVWVNNGVISNCGFKVAILQ